MKKENIFDVIAILVTIVLALVGIICYFCRFSINMFDSQESFAEFGDYVGGVIGTIVSFLSLVYIYKTYRKQVEFSSNEIALSYKQQFETSFFALIQHHYALKKTLTSADDNGKSYFERVSEELRERMMEREYDLDCITYENRFKEEDIANSIYDEVYDKYGNQLGHYFRALYHIISYVDDSEIGNKKMYMDIIQSQLSNSELYILFYNGISQYGKKRMYPLLEKYGILEHVIYSDFEYFYRHQTLFYPKTTFKNNPEMQKNIIFLGGVHCVGKNTLCSASLSDTNILALSASDVLRWSEISPKENKKVKDINATQDRLIEGLRKMVELDRKYVLDGHFCLLDKDGEVKRVPFETFRAINPSGIVVLTDSPSLIVKRLKERDNTKYTASLIDSFQQEEVAYAKEVANILSIPYIELKGAISSAEKFLKFVRDVLKI